MRSKWPSIAPVLWTSGGNCRGSNAAGAVTASIRRLATPVFSLSDSHLPRAPRDSSQRNRAGVRFGVKLSFFSSDGTIFLTRDFATCKMRSRVKGILSSLESIPS